MKHKLIMETIGKETSDKLYLNKRDLGNYLAEIIKECSDEMSENGYGWQVKKH